MCTRYIAQPMRAEIAHLFDARLNGEDGPVSELFPGRDGPVIGLAKDGTRGLSLMRWGFPPPAGVKAPVVNVRNYASPFWRSALANPQRRCLVPVSRFCEWETMADSRKVPRWFSVPSRAMFAFAGIWRPLTGEGGPGACYAFLTCAPNPLVGPIHPKAMPVILHKEDEQRWLTAPIDDALALAQPFPSQLMALADIA